MHQLSNVCLLVSSSAPFVRCGSNTQCVGRASVTKRSFAEELPRLLDVRGMTLRALAREAGTLDHAYLSRMLSGQLPTNADQVRRIAEVLGLPQDYFPEVREAEVIKAIRRRPKLRDELYFERIKPSRS